MTTLIVHVYCGNFVGPPHWHGLDYYEPDECDWEDDIEVEVIEGEDWRKFAFYTCKGCGATNMVTDHENLN